jgi:polysaccharide export outer membrane protein
MLHLLSVMLFLLQTSAQPPAVPRAEPSSSGDYVVGAQDVLKVTVFDEPQLSGTFRVDTDGTFTYPFVGRITATGQTLRSIESTLTTLLADGYVKRPQVAIEVEEYRSRSIFVVGEVRTPGKYPLTGQMTLIEALAQAGSTTATASSEVLILRRPAGAGADGAALSPGAPGVMQTLRVSLTDMQSGRESTNPVLQEGDTIFVARAERFYVTGQVRSPGAYTYERGMTVLQAISLAGGLSDRGSNRGIKIVRMTGGKKREIGAKLEDLIEPNDTIVVRQRLL